MPVYNWHLGRQMEYVFPEVHPKKQFVAIFNINRCIGCQTCSVACKVLWTRDEGTDYQWWCTVNTLPGRGHPRDWETMGGGYREDVPQAGRRPLREGRRPAGRASSAFHCPEDRRRGLHHPGEDARGAAGERDALVDALAGGREVAHGLVVERAGDALHRFLGARAVLARSSSRRSRTSTPRPTPPAS